MKLRCVKNYEVLWTDESGCFPEEEDWRTVKKGTVWDFIESKDKYDISGEIRLENKDGDWLEMPMGILKEYFEEVKE